MDPIPIALALAGGLLAGVFLGWFLSASRSRTAETAMQKFVEENASLRTRLEEREARLSELGGELQNKESSLALLQNELGASREDKARLQTELKNQGSAIAEKLVLLQQAEQQLREAFQSLSLEALRQNNQSFLELARASLSEFQKQACGDLESRQKAISEMMLPVRESLEKVESKLQDVEKQRIGAYAGLSEQVRSLASTQVKLQSETANLVKALRAPTVRGRWGEIQLRRVVEMAGMLEHCDFWEQKSVVVDDGRLRPDLLVRLPGGKNVIVDAKAPLSGYLESTEASDELLREEKLRLHARQVRDHIAKLGSKSYWDQFRPAPEFVVMFLPGETFFGAALQHEPDLIEYGVDRKVIPASPTTLIALLRAVAYGWRQEKLAESAEAISELGRTLYKRLCVAARHLNDVGVHLDRASAAYNRAVGSLERQVFSAARRFKDLGAGTSDELSELRPAEDSTRGMHAVELVRSLDCDPEEAETIPEHRDHDQKPEP